MARFRDYGNPDCKLYVGDLGSSASKQELEETFSHYGTLRNVWVARNPPGFAFVEFEDTRDAEDAVRGMDGRTICGRRVRVEMSNGRGEKGRSRGGPPASRERPFHPEDRCYECGERGHYARDCNRYRGGKGGGRRRSYSRSRSKSRSRDRRTRSRSGSRSRSRGRARSKSRDRSSRDRDRAPKDRSRSRDRSPPGRQRSRDRGRSRSQPAKRSPKSRSRSRTRDSADRNGKKQNDA